MSRDLVSEERQRIDKWLWHARVVRTRSAAAALAASGHVRLNGGRVDAPARPVKIGDVVTVALDRRVRILKVLRFADRRASAAATEGLYEDLSTGSDALVADTAVRTPGAGRPTKQDRRVIDRLLGRDEPR